jgi:hypothetical protein
MEVRWWSGLAGVYMGEFSPLPNPLRLGEGATQGITQDASLNTPTSAINCLA